MKFLAHVRLLSILGPAVRTFGSFLVFAAGVALISWGAYLIRPALGLLVAGVLLVTIAVLYERHSAMNAAAARAGRE